jgi:hypothetical protein
MLRLTEHLFRARPLAKYADYYEKTLYNHILSTQHPEHGGYVYFTPARPRHYRVYSAPNEGMWCCVGSGMENHGKYNQFIYTHHQDSLFLNLFIPSELNWKEKGLILRQETLFPDEEQTKLTVKEGSANFILMIRYPSWIKEGELKISINGKPISYKGNPSSYIAVDRKWKKGDVIQVLLPMNNSIEQLPNVPEYLAFMHGPILLGAKSGTQDLKGLIADDSRWGHIAHGEKLPVAKAPILVDDNITGIAGKLIPVKGKTMTYSASGLKMVNGSDIELEPFYRIHDSRYIMYWMTLTNANYKSYVDSITLLENVKLELQKRTIDFVAPGEQQPEADHLMQMSRSNTGNNLDEFWRDAGRNGFFSYNMKTDKESNLGLVVRYWGAETGNRQFEIYIDDEKLVTENLAGKWNQKKFQEIEYDIPDTMIKDKDNVRVKFQPLAGNSAGPIYYVRLVRKIKK